MALYRPPIVPTTIQMPLIALVTRSDPDFQRQKYREVEYEFENKVFLANPYTAGSANNNPNIYPVGTQPNRG